MSNKFHKTIFATFPCPDLSSSMSPFSVPISRLTPQRAAQRISELNLFLYLRISGVSLVASWEVGVTLTFTWLSRRDGPEPPAPKPKVRKLRCFCCRLKAWGGSNCNVCWETYDGDRWWFKWLRCGGGWGDKLWLILWLLLELWPLFSSFVFIEWIGLLWREEEEFEAVEWGDELDIIKDLEGVEWTELTAARYWKLPEIKNVCR